MEYTQMGEGAFLLIALAWAVFQFGGLVLLGRWLCPRQCDRSVTSHDLSMAHSVTES